MDILLSVGQQNKTINRLRVALATAIDGDEQQYPGLAQDDNFDALTEAAVRHWQSGVGIIADGIVGPYCQSVLGLAAFSPLDIELTASFVKALFPATKISNIQRYLPYVSTALQAAGLNDAPMVLAALGTIRAETEGFVPIAEFPSKYNTKPGMPAFSNYDNRLGNNQTGDGCRYRGRGFVQLTGRENYRRYAKIIGIDIEAAPDLANAPEVAAVLLARFLSAFAEKMRAELAAQKYAAARKLVNGGAHGLDRFKNVFEIAAATTALAEAGKRLRAQTGRTPKRDAVKDPADLRDRAYTPPPINLPDVFPDDAHIGKYLPIYTAADLILDQGEEGACTGFGLACVINYLRWRKVGASPDLQSVSPRMLYNYARRYDEYAGEEYEGSSCRGALKGWFHHGVCLERDWPYRQADTTPPRFGYAQRATANTLGIYYRIDTKIISDLQAAIHEVGAIYVSTFTHAGWDDLPKSRKKTLTHATLPIIPFDGIPSQSDGHAFALVGFNTHGFIVQNSWGNSWGLGGFAVLSYFDWLANGMDAWVAALGVSGVMLGQLARGPKVSGGQRIASNRSAWWDESKAYEHSVVLGNNGRVANYLTEDELNRSLQFQACDLPDQWFRAQPSTRKRLVIFAHGGLNSEADAIVRARALGKYFIGNDCYPLFMVWKTGLLETLGSIIEDRFSRKSRVGGARESIQDFTDNLLEQTIGRPFAKPLWSEMKENAEFANQPTRGGDLLVTALQNLASTWGNDLEIHLIGHSAGAIFLGWLVDLIAARGLETQLTSLHLYAPACTVQFANRHFAPHQALLQNFFMDVLSDENERDDNVASVYKKSLLYFVSNALENDKRTPLLGLANILDPNYTSWDGSSTSAEALKKWRQTVEDAQLMKAKRINIIAPRKTVTRIGSNGEGDVAINTAHGSFDNAVAIVSRTLERVTGAALKIPVDDLRGF